MQAKGSTMSAYLGAKSSQTASVANKPHAPKAVSKTRVEAKHHGQPHPQHRVKSISADEPNMSDTGLLVTVEDLINTCFGQSDLNVVNFKMLQTILRFLAQQLRMMDHQVQMLEERMPAAGSDVSSEASEGSKKKSPRKKRLISKPSRDAKSDTKVLHEKSEASFISDKSEAKIREKSAGSVGSVKAVNKHKEDKGAKAKVGSIEVVTLSQFRLLEKAVTALKAKAGPLPVPTLPDNKQLKQDILKGNATLVETMEAMRVSSRIHAAETAMGRLIELMTEVARAGGLPRDLAAKVQQIAHDTAEVLQQEKEVKAGKSITQHDAMSKMSWRSETWSRPQSKVIRPEGAPAEGQRLSIDSDMLTMDDMKEIIRQFRIEVFKTMNEITAHATAAADAAVAMAMDAQDKMQIAVNLDDRISTLHGLVSEYTQQYTGLDSGLATQITSFQEQLNQVRSEMNVAVVQMSKITNNAETAAVIELTERYQALLNNLETTLYGHRHLDAHQIQLTDELQSLVSWVEMLREQKADRDEVMDGLKDKADISRLSGMLMQEDFDFQRTGFELRVQMVYEKFRKQDNVWMAAVKDFTELIALKANTDQVLLLRADLETGLQELHENVKVLQRILGQPKAAMARRTLRINASCGACGEPAVLDPGAPRAPRRLPALRSAPPAAPDGEEPCLTAFSAADEPPEGKRHMCRRWVGGSHTLISHAGTRERPHTVIPPLSRKAYIGLGTDNKFYKLEKPLLPCKCNLEDDVTEPLEETTRLPEIGAGDQEDIPPDTVIQDVPSPDLASTGSVIQDAGGADGPRSTSMILNVEEDRSVSFIVNVID